MSSVRLLERRNSRGSSSSPSSGRVRSCYKWCLLLSILAALLLTKTGLDSISSHQIRASHDKVNSPVIISTGGFHAPADEEVVEGETTKMSRTIGPNVSTSTRPEANATQTTSSLKKPTHSSIKTTIEKTTSEMMSAKAGNTSASKTNEQIDERKNVKEETSISQPRPEVVWLMSFPNSVRFFM